MRMPLSVFLSFNSDFFPSNAGKGHCVMLTNLPAVRHYVGNIFYYESNLTVGWFLN